MRTEVMIGVGASLKDSLPAEKAPEQPKTPEKNPEREKVRTVEGRLGAEEKEKAPGKGGLSESPGKNKGGTPKKNEVRNVFAGPRPSPKKNPWTRNTSSEGGKESVKEAPGVPAASGKEAPVEVKGIEIPKAEVGWQ